MMVELECLDDEQMRASRKMVVQKKMVFRAYNKRMKMKTFQKSEIVWKKVLPIGMKGKEFKNIHLIRKGPIKFTKY